MKYINIQYSLIKQKPVFTAKDLELAGFRIGSYRLSEWVKKGYIVRLMAGKYLFTKAEVMPEYIANQLREPSYISLESALYYYNLTVDIPFHITSVTTRGTRTIRVQDKTYFYQHIKTDVFTDYVLQQSGQKDEIGKRFYIATPEKALVDLLYLQPKKWQKPSDFVEARFHEEDMRTKLDWRGVYNLVKLYNNKSLAKRVDSLKSYLSSV